MDQSILVGEDAVLHNQLNSSNAIWFMSFHVMFGIWMRAVSNINQPLELNSFDSILAFDSQSKISFGLFFTSLKSELILVKTRLARRGKTFEKKKNSLW